MLIHPVLPYEQLAERWSAIMEFSAKVIGGTVPLIFAAIGVWRKIKARWEERDALNDERATEAAKKVASTAVAATHTLAADVKRTIEQAVGTEGDGTLRQIVETQATELQKHAEKAAEFRVEILGKVGSVERELGTLNEAIIRVLSKMANL